MAARKPSKPPVLIDDVLLMDGRSPWDLIISFFPKEGELDSCKTSKSLSKVESIQRRALRFLHDDNDSSYEDLLTKTGKNFMSVYRLKSLCIEIFKTINNLNPIYMKDIFQLAITDRPVRQHNTHNLKKVSMRTTTFGTKSLTSLGPTIWNKLPAHLKSAENLVGFRKMIKNWNREKCSCKLCEGA